MSNDKETETPLTDAEEIHPDCDDSCLDIYYRNPQGDLVKVDGWVVDAEFARDLERQLAESVSKADVEDALYDDWKRINRLSQCRLIDLGINPQLEKESNNEQR